MANASIGFETELKRRFQEIFRLKNTTFSKPGETEEQETLFIQVNESNPKISFKKEIYRVVGQGIVFAEVEKMPAGYFAKAIQMAPHELTKDFSFLKVDQSQDTFANIVRRSFDFVFLYSRQYDPNQGELTQVEIGEGTYNG